MKASKIIWLVILVFCLFQGCHFGHNGKTKQLIETSNEEEFDKFQKLFYSDSVFQMSRIIFPLASDIKDSSSSNHVDDSAIILSRQNWIMLQNDFFIKNDSIANIGDRIYKKKIKRTDSQIVESIYIEDSGFRESMTFSLKKGKWYLIDFTECDN